MYMSTDTSGHEHDDEGKFSAHASKVRGNKSIVTKKALRLSRAAKLSRSKKDHAQAAEAHEHAVVGGVEIGLGGLVGLDGTADVDDLGRLRGHGSDEKRREKC